MDVSEFQLSTVSQGPCWCSRTLEICWGHAALSRCDLLPPVCSFSALPPTTSHTNELMGHPGASSSRRLASRRSLQGCLSNTTGALVRFGMCDTEIRRYLVTTTTARGPSEVFPEPHAVRYLGQIRNTQPVAFSSGGFFATRRHGARPKFASPFSSAEGECDHLICALKLITKI